MDEFLVEATLFEGEIIILNHIKCTDYESVVAITRTWPLSGIVRESEHGTACQWPDGRWTIIESTS